VDETKMPKSTGRSVTRRDAITRGIKTGAGITVISWSAPVLRSTALAQNDGTPVPGGRFGISFIALLLNCDGKTYRVKFEDTNNFGAPECGPNFNTTDNSPRGNCDDPFYRNDPSVEEGCPEGVSATQNSDGSVTVTTGGCVVQDFLVKCGQCCFGPGEGNQPAAGLGPVTFQQCSANQPPCT
jgi:hypothetical protein